MATPSSPSLSLFKTEHIGKNNEPIRKCVLDVGSIARAEELDLYSGSTMVQYLAELVGVLRSQGFSIFLALPELAPRVKREMEAVGDLNQCKWIVSKGKETTILAADVAKQKGAILFSNKKLPSSKRVKQVTREWYAAHREPFPGNIPVGTAPKTAAPGGRGGDLTSLPPSRVHGVGGGSRQGSQFAPIPAMRYTSPSPSSSVDSGRGTPKGRYKWRPCRHYLWNNHDHVGKQCGFLHPCLDFIEGRCLSGGNCENDHLCIDDLLGQCPVGDRCTLCHVDPSEKENLCNFILDQRPSARSVLVMRLQSSRVGETSPIAPPSMHMTSQLPPPPMLSTPPFAAPPTSSWGPSGGRGGGGSLHGHSYSLGAIAPPTAARPLDRDRSFSLETESASTHSFDGSLHGEPDNGDRRIFGGAGGTLGFEPPLSHMPAGPVPNYGGVTHAGFQRDLVNASPANSLASGTASESSAWDEASHGKPAPLPGIGLPGGPLQYLQSPVEMKAGDGLPDLLHSFQGLNMANGDSDSDSVHSGWSSTSDTFSTDRRTPFDGLAGSLGGFPPTGVSSSVGTFIPAVSSTASAPGPLPASAPLSAPQPPGSAPVSTVGTSLAAAAPPGFGLRSKDDSQPSAFGSIRNGFQPEEQHSYFASFGSGGQSPLGWGGASAVSAEAPQSIRISQLSRPNRIGRVSDLGSSDWSSPSSEHYLSSPLI